MPTTKSNSIAIIFSMFLWVSFGLSVISGLFTSFYMVNFHWYEKHLASLDQYFSITNRLLYYMEIVIFLIWLFQLHRDLRRCFRFYPITPWGAVIRMMPLINIWGLGSTFGNISKLIKRYDERISRNIKYLIPFLYLTFFGLNNVNKWIQRQDAGSNEPLLIVGTLFEIAFALVLILMAVNINRGMLLVSSSNEDKMNMKVEPRLVKTIQSYMRAFNSISTIKSLLTEQFIKDMYVSSHYGIDNELTTDEMFKIIEMKNKGKAELTLYTIDDYDVIDDETFEVCISREFAGGYKDKIRYILKKYGASWKFDRIIRF